MIRLFRKIRMYTFFEGKVSKYIAYALGETFLIVLGILIALGINNWNEQRQIRTKEKFYLNGLKSEFEQSKAKLQTLIDVNRLNYEESKQIAGFINNDNFPEEKELSALLFNAFSYEIAYNPNNSLLNEVISTGMLKNISNADLRLELTSWESVIQGIHRQEETLREQRSKTLEIFRSEEGSIRTILDQADISTEKMGMEKSKKFVSNQHVLQSTKFEDNLLLFILTGMITETTHYKPLQKRIDHILFLIENELE